MSRSMRSVWIEICGAAQYETYTGRHAPCGACGLKYVRGQNLPFDVMSRSMRSVWIEIFRRA